MEVYKDLEKKKKIVCEVIIILVIILGFFTCAFDLFKYGETSISGYSIFTESFTQLVNMNIPLGIFTTLYVTISIFLLLYCSIKIFFDKFTTKFGFYVCILYIISSLIYFIMGIVIRELMLAIYSSSNLSFQTLSFWPLIINVVLTIAYIFNLK